MSSPAAFTSIDSAILASHYSRFKVSERILLTGHSHQAWPDVAWAGVTQALEDAALKVDEKWELAFERAEHVRAGYRALLGGLKGDLALAPNTHELLVRLLSALPLKERPEIVTTEGEFHTVRRQLLRLTEEGIVVRWIPTAPIETLSARMAEAITRKTSLVICSSVLFESARIVPHLAHLAQAADASGAALLIDTYHQLNIVPFEPQGLENAFILGGGYKYCQLGEGNCFLRSPEDSALRPVYTGWFADFSALSGPATSRVQYGAHAGARFAGSTYDPISHYRATAVFEFFQHENLNVARLRARSQAQLARLASGFDALKLPGTLIQRDLSTPLEKVGGFLALRTPQAAEFEKELLKQGVHTDHRGQALRLGPAPYLTDRQLDEAIARLGSVARTLA